MTLDVRTAEGEERRVLADVEGVELEQRPFTWTPAGFVAVLRVGPGRYRLFVHEHAAAGGSKTFTALMSDTSLSRLPAQTIVASFGAAQTSA